MRRPIGLADIARPHRRNVRLDDAALAPEGDLDPAGRAGPALADDMARQHAGAVLGEGDVMGAQEQRRRPVLHAGGVEGQRLALEIDAAALDRRGNAAQFADEAEDEGRGRRVVDLVGRADLLDAALVEDDDPVGELERLVLVVGDEDGGVAGLVVDLAQPAAQLLAHLGVERAEGLVEQQHPRLDRERAGERDALALAAGELAGIAPGEAAELDEIEELADAAVDLGARPGRSRRGRTRRP